MLECMSRNSNFYKTMVKYYSDRCFDFLFNSTNILCQNSLNHVITHKGLSLRHLTMTMVITITHSNDFIRNLHILC